MEVKYKRILLTYQTIRGYDPACVTVTKMLNMQELLSNINFREDPSACNIQLPHHKFARFHIYIQIQCLRVSLTRLEFF